MVSTIAVDAMGGDRGAPIPVEAALMAARQGSRIILVGDEKIIAQALERIGGELPEGVELFHAPDVIEMHEKPSQAVRKKRRASLCVAARLVREGRADATVSAGNSGAAVAAGLFELGRIAGVQRPALASAFPTKKGPAVVLDLGANIDPTAVQLAQFAVMGDAYARTVLKREHPRVALLCNGSEEVKGTDRTRAAHEILSRATIDYAGYCEGRELFDGELDVIVTDGFTGNVLLKTLEGFVGAIREILEREIRASIAATAGALLMRNIFGTIKRKLDYEEAGGAPLLGLESNSLVAHGSSSVNALRNAIHAAEVLSETHLIEAIAESIQRNAEAGLWPKGRTSDRGAPEEEERAE
jgi:glycerol-3-phosphate acyltransferase PlsX